MNACNQARSELDRMALAFCNLADSRQLNLIERYQTRLHNRHPRTLRDFIPIRKSFPPSEPGDPGLYEVPPSCVPTLSDPEAAPPTAPSSKSIASPLRNEPKPTFALNEFLPTEPANQPGATPPVPAPEQHGARAPQPGSTVLSGKTRSQSEEWSSSLRHSLSLGDSAVTNPPTLASQIPNLANHLAPSGQPQEGSH